VDAPPSFSARGSHAPGRLRLPPLFPAISGYIFDSSQPRSIDLPPSCLEPPRSPRSESGRAAFILCAWESRAWTPSPAASFSGRLRRSFRLRFVNLAIELDPVRLITGQTIVNGPWVLAYFGPTKPAQSKAQIIHCHQPPPP